MRRKQRREGSLGSIMDDAMVAGQATSKPKAAKLNANKGDDGLMELQTSDQEVKWTSCILWLSIRMRNTLSETETTADNGNNV